MNLRQLEVFLAVVQEGSFSRGAERCYLRQSTVSQHIAALEEELQVELLERGGRRVRPTEAGRLLLNYSSRMLSLREEASAAMGQLRGLEQGTLRIGGSNIPAVHIIPQAFCQFHVRHPGIELNLVQGDSRTIVDQVIDGALDLGVVGAPFRGKGVTLEEFRRDRLILVVPPGHDFADRGVILPAELQRVSFVGREEGSGTRKAIETALAEKLPGLKETVRLGSNEAVKEAVLLGMGLGFVSSLSVERELGRGELVEVDVEGVTLERSLYLALPERGLSAAAAALVAQLRQQNES